MNSFLLFTFENWLVSSFVIRLWSLPYNISWLFKIISQTYSYPFFLPLVQGPSWYFPKLGTRRPGKKIQMFFGLGFLVVLLLYLKIHYLVLSEFVITSNQASSKEFCNIYLLLSVLLWLIFHRYSKRYNTKHSTLLYLAAFLYIT